MRETRWLNVRVDHERSVERFSAKRVCLPPIGAAISLVAPTPRNLTKAERNLPNYKLSYSPSKPFRCGRLPPYS